MMNVSNITRPEIEKQRDEGLSLWRLLVWTDQPTKRLLVLASIVDAVKGTHLISSDGDHFR